ncbi:adenosylcobinamide-GDP ribazoletransferase [Phaeobacter gallaeciensis]|uniref:adenosylcobinamide-GDP ribazoletransferase n=1 Tax=Phaeobacter gallaeciensis TaxID=60890 RepID=UPI00237F5C81|nr:adenosylcobinamide-GDP ribazoletransferase [Phaeobacter gallaeciensis]MDE4191653.1 adenosylcobinamide-GDP ribazoletransferase [Phaeobacter gallaeciensis]MDE4200116.1 adenosylcobinamide-GDP ribazoletransferase [Phaeobacter gallaeciensis]MDE4204436.1 adenosylcobinamide-GDP ribazoletransferase [Phaeobacter gallaeciensis]MDE4208408.1 adenosylcobinamide-GDP ribazoletransferase [Phaeobacter gallaeciensis]MDE4216945.1 adenosylcobinamide-GDP ribazoletransferase [Phaeobacter gallaeciensis]
MRKTDIRAADIPLALVLLTRLPLPHLSAETFKRQSAAVWAFPLAGVTVALPATIAASLALTLGLPPLVAAGLALAMQILLTGAMHEDGLADTADGLWGGFEQARRLEIMKDSQIGTYGVLALILGLGLRWVALAALLETAGPWPLLALAMLSRAAMPVLMYALPHARADGLSRSVGRPRALPVVLGGVLALGLALPCIALSQLLAVAAIMAVVTAGLGALARVKIGGQTGDILGATQQLCELTGLLVLLAL